MSKASDKREQTSGYVFMADSYFDGDGERTNLIGKLLLTGHLDVVWANHCGDPDIKNHTHVLWREPASTSISAVARKYNHPARLIQCIGHDTEHRNYKGAMIYLLHIDRKSVAAGKKKYTIDSLYGPWKNKTIEVISKYSDDCRSRDNDILLILDWVEKHANCSTADLIRWCCTNNLYSVYRRSASVVNAVLRELRDIRRADDYIASVGSRLSELESKTDKIAESAKDKKRYAEIAQHSAKVNMELVNQMIKSYYDYHQVKLGE